MSAHKQISPKGRGLLVAVAAAALCLPLLSAAAATSGSSDKAVRTFVDANGNRVEVVDPGQSTYIPNVKHTSKHSVAKAQRLLDGTLKFCRTHSVKKIMAHWRVGGMGMGGMGGMKANTMPPTHYFNPNPMQGLHPMHPTAALVYDGKLGGVMLNGQPLDYLGTIPRAHAHKHMVSTHLEMVHIYCTKNLTFAFTPNRTLGVMSPTINLRLKIRPAIMDLTRRQLKVIDAMVTMYVKRDGGMKTAPDAIAKGPKPALQAMRIHIRESLMVLTQHQLRMVWKKMVSF
jgi:hypothetical protein